MLFLYTPVAHPDDLDVFIGQKSGLLKDDFDILPGVSNH